MKVHYLTAGVFDKGGISRYNRHQVNALRDLLGAGNVTVVSLLGPGGTANDLETPFEVDWHGRRASGALPDKLGFIWAVLRLSRAQKPDLIWCAHLHFAGLAHVAARLNGTDDVVQVYGREVWSPRWHRPDAGWGLRRARYAVADCHATADYVEQVYRARDQVDVMWDPVDTERFTPGPPSAAVLSKYHVPDPSAGFNILTLGRMSRSTVYKGYERLLDAFAKLPRNARLIYGGGGDLIPSLQRRAGELGVSERVVFTGFIDEADLPDIYRSASVFCLIGDRGPGRGEGIPLTPLEAGACGVPIMVGDQDGSREAVEQGVNGFALDPFDLETIALRLNLLLSEETSRSRMGDAARSRVTNEHAYPVFRERMRRFLERVSADQGKYWRKP